MRFVRRWKRAVLALLATGIVALLPITSFALELQSIERAAAGYTNSNARLQEMFRAALLDTSKLAEYAPDGTAYIKTGDIPAEWLRDASAQARPYLFFAKNDPDVRSLLRAHHRPHGQVPADRSVRQRLHVGLPRLGAEVRTRLAGLSDDAGVELLEDDGRPVHLQRRLFDDARQRAGDDAARTEPSA